MSSAAVFGGNTYVSSPLFTNRTVKPLGFDPLSFRFAISTTKFKFKGDSFKRPNWRKTQQATSFWRWSEPKRRGFSGEVPEFKSIADFTRFRDNGQDGEELQTAIVSYRKQFPGSILNPQQQVDLVAAVHIADKDDDEFIGNNYLSWKVKMHTLLMAKGVWALIETKVVELDDVAAKNQFNKENGYFATLQKELASYDRVLYEMVAEKDPLQTNRNPRMRWMPPKRLPGVRIRNFSIIGIIQRLMAQLLSLDFQLECLDYRRSNWYHADLDYQTFKLLQFERGENFFTFARDMTVLSTKAITKSVLVPEDLDPWRSKLLWASRVLPMPLVGLVIIESVCARSDSPITESPEVKALFRLDLAAAMKVFLAKQITSELTDGTTELVENSVIIGERNRVAMEELQGAINDGCKKIAILYGGGHMPDMDRRLRKDFGLVPTRMSWRTAWSIRNQKLKDQRQLPVFLNNLVKLSGWQLNRYQTLALLLFSLVLAVDLWFWELFITSIKEWADQSLMVAVQLLEHT